MGEASPGNLQYGGIHGYPVSLPSSHLEHIMPMPLLLRHPQQVPIPKILPYRLVHTLLKMQYFHTGQKPPEMSHILQLLQNQHNLVSCRVLYEGSHLLQEDNYLVASKRCTMAYVKGGY
jgi:hypothetical protein